jgi:hypothetical protein
MNMIRRYWAAGLILVMVLAHAIVISYVRSRISLIGNTESTAVEVGEFRFQTTSDPTSVYHFRMHVVIDPAKRKHSNERIEEMRMEILEASEQLLRQVDVAWLDDPVQTELRDRLMDVVLTHLDEPLVQRLLITDWLKLPVSSIPVVK